MTLRKRITKIKYMKAEEFLKKATEGTEAGEVIKDSYLTETIVKLLNNYAEIKVKNFSISDIKSSYSYLQNGDKINKTDEYLNDENEWVDTQSTGQIFNHTYFKKHRRPNYA